ATALDRFTNAAALRCLKAIATAKATSWTPSGFVVDRAPLTSILMESVTMSMIALALTMLVVFVMDQGLFMNVVVTSFPLVTATALATNWIS
ncbi:MAG: hypothetical protein ACPGYM_07360, partial [Flavobacteriales bacterium]